MQNPWEAPKTNDKIAKTNIKAFISRIPYFVFGGNIAICLCVLPEELIFKFLGGIVLNGLFDFHFAHAFYTILAVPIVLLVMSLSANYRPSLWLLVVLNFVAGRHEFFMCAICL